MPKYSESNPPLVCMQTTSRCYKKTTTMTPVGVLWHSTGCKSPYISRYVQPSDDAEDRAEWIEKLGENKYKNDWNHTDRQAGLNCWVGKLADGSVTTVQTMPWTYKPWGCGSGENGSCNSGWIQFEICEDQTSQEHFEQCFEEACQITAYLCKLYGLDPDGTVKVKDGLEVPVILCHKDSYKYGMGSDHSDIYEWFKIYGKDMTDVRERVKEIMAEDTVKRGWVKTDDGRWTYYDEGEMLLAQWVKYSKKWYYLMADGTMARGWAKIGKKLYYLDPKNGDMKTGEIEIDGQTYHFGEDGALIS